MVHIAHDGKIRRHAFHRICDDVEMLACLQGDIDADGAGERACPHTACDYDLVGFDDAFSGFNPRGTTVLNDNSFDQRVFLDFNARHACALGQRHRRINRITLAIGRIPDRADDIVDIHQRPFGLCFLG